MRQTYAMIGLLLTTALVACSSEPTATQTVSETTAATASDLNLRTLTEQNLVDILIGSCIQSTRNCDPSDFVPLKSMTYQRTAWSSLCKA